MENYRKNYGPTQVSDLVGRIIDPALRKKAGISVSLISEWDAIVSAELADCTRPVRIDWPRRGGPDDDFSPGTLVLACDQSAVLKVQYQTTELISRLNAFFGYAAVNRIRIVQRPVISSQKTAPETRRVLSETEEHWIAGITQNIEDEELRKSLEELGRSIVGEISP